MSAYDKQLACDAHYPDTSSYQFRGQIKGSSSFNPINPISPGMAKIYSHNPNKFAIYPCEDQSVFWIFHSFIFLRTYQQASEQLSVITEAMAKGFSPSLWNADLFFKCLKSLLHHRSSPTHACLGESCKGVGGGTRGWVLWYIMCLSSGGEARVVRG